MEANTLAVKPGTYRLDPVHSTVGFSVIHKVSKFRGTFADVDATLEVNPSGEVTLTGSASVASVQVRVAEMTAHLQSPDFFDAERHPDVTFRSTSVSVADDGALSVTGDLTMRGHTEHVEATGTFTYMSDDGHGHERAGVDLEAVVNRHDFGISHTQQMPDGSVNVESEVTLTVELELARA